MGWIKTRLSSLQRAIGRRKQTVGERTGDDQLCAEGRGSQVAAALASVATDEHPPPAPAGAPGESPPNDAPEETHP